ncbi:MAG: DNA alkylation repair protein [Sphingobacteriaceae bacterium]|nr:DNA alkylation repair protein [Sphingobacteriaceae bacterium]
MADFVLKDAFDPAFIHRLAQACEKLQSGFNKAAFLAEALPENWTDFSLKARMRHLSLALGKHLNGSYAKQLEVVLLLAPQFNGLAGMLFPDFVEVHGQADPDRSIPALAQLTQHFSAEFAVRPFLQQHPERMLLQHHAWAEHPNEHVRRLASEGIRPRLPWGQDVAWVKKDPAKVLPILEKLRNDPSEYVRRSVANNLNDISKSHPELVLSLAQRWIGQAATTDALLKHALRGLLKNGHPQALQLFGFGGEVAFALSNVQISPSTLAIGQKLSFAFELQHLGTQPAKYRLEYLLHYVKMNGSLSPKVFQIAEKTLQPNEKWLIQRQHSFEERTTRKHQPGIHQWQLQLNGQLQSLHPIELLAP